MNKNNKVLLFSAGLFAVSFCIAPVLSGITVTLWNDIFGTGFSLIMLWGSAYYTIGRVFLDVIQEFYGRKTRTAVVKITLLLRLLTYGITTVGLLLPNAAYNDGTQAVLTVALRMTVAGVVDMYLTQRLLDPLVYSKVSKAFKGRAVFLRGFISNLASTLVHSVVFFHLAFWDKLNFLFAWIGDRNIGKPYGEILNLMLSDPILDIPFLFLSALFGAAVIAVIKKKTGMRSMRDTRGADIGETNLLGGNEK
jgi:uncharacterized integral membrane protein (TIGR00697 family)